MSDKAAMQAWLRCQVDEAMAEIGDVAVTVIAHPSRETADEQTGLTYDKVCDMADKALNEAYDWSAERRRAAAAFAAAKAETLDQWFVRDPPHVMVCGPDTDEAFAHYVGQQSDAAAGLRPLPTKPLPKPEPPFVPNKFGEHGGR